MSKVKKILSALLCLALLCALCTVGGSAYSGQTVYFVFTVGEEAIRGCREGESTLDKYLAYLEAEDSTVRVPLALDADALTYDTDFIYALLKLKVAGYDCLVIGGDSENAAEALAYIRHITKMGVSLWLDASGALSASSLYQTVSCRYRTGTFSEFRRLITEKTGCIAMDMTADNLYALQLILDFCESGGYEPAGLCELMKNDITK